MQPLHICLTPGLAITESVALPNIIFPNQKVILYFEHEAQFENNLVNINHITHKHSQEILNIRPLPNRLGPMITTIMLLNDNCLLHLRKFNPVKKNSVWVHMQHQDPESRIKSKNPVLTKNHLPVASPFHFTQNCLTTQRKRLLILR